MMLTAPNISVGGSQPSQQLLLPRIPPPARGAKKSPSTLNLLFSARSNVSSTDLSAMSGAKVFRGTTYKLPREELREIFNLMVKDNVEFISTAELGQLMKTVGLESSEEELRAIIREVDIDGNGMIDFEEFVLVCSRNVAAQITAEELTKAFASFKQPDDPPGHVKITALLEGMTKYGTTKRSSKAVQALLNQHDSSGLLNFEDYVNIMCNS